MDARGRAMYVPRLPLYVPLNVPRLPTNVQCVPMMNVPLGVPMNVRLAARGRAMAAHERDFYVQLAARSERAMAAAQ